MNEYKIYWDISNNVPKVINISAEASYIENANYKYIAMDLRPVFLEEKHLLLCLFAELFNDSIYKKSIWATKNNRYIIDGEIFDLKVNQRVKEIENINEFRKKVLNISDFSQYVSDEFKIIQGFIRENRERLYYITRSEELDSEGYPVGAYPFVESIYTKYYTRLPLVSFSGGKDSTAVSQIVRKALNNQSIIHIFGDTTLELANTYEYVNKFKEENPMVPFLDEKNEENDFFEMCKELGPPSRVKSWCCSIFKTGPMGTTLSNFDEFVLTFLGIRRSESVSRSKYQRVSQSPKILKQIAALPMVDWLDIDVWLYIFSENITYNYSYRQGFTRVGCWVCPHNSDWSTFLASIYNSKEYEKWYSFLIDFAKSIGKIDYEVYINEGYWKARQGGAGLEKSREVIIDSKECVNEKNSMNYSLSRPINEEFYELFKPFGKLKHIDKAGMRETFVLSKENTSIFKILCALESTDVKITIIDSDDRYIFNKIKKQLNKFNSCMYCLACNSACPVGAISVTNNKYKIDETVCINCLKCVEKFETGCLVTYALKIKQGS